MKNITVFVSENFKFLEEKFSIYLNRRVFVMTRQESTNKTRCLYVETRQQESYICTLLDSMQLSSEIPEESLLKCGTFISNA